MAKISGAILTDGLENVAKMIANDSPAVAYYAGMGAGIDDTAALATQHDLLAAGGEREWNDSDGSYEANFKSVWQSVFLYADFTSHTIKELVICESAASHLNKCLLRMTIDPIELELDEQVSIIIKCQTQQGS